MFAFPSNRHAARPPAMRWGSPDGVVLLAGQEGFEPPTGGFGDRCSTVGATGLNLCSLNLAFSVDLVLPAAGAELTEFELVLLLPAVLRGRIVPLLAHRALERDDAAVSLRHGAPLMLAPWQRARCPGSGLLLLNDVGDHAGAHRPAALADGEAQLLLHGDGGNQLHLHGDVIARHHHLHVVRQLHRAGHVGGAEVELRLVALEEGSVPPALLL